MHKIIVKYYEWNTCIEEGYRVSLHCDEVYDNRELALFQDGDDAIRYAYGKALELGLMVDIWNSVKEKMGKKEIKKKKKGKK